MSLTEGGASEYLSIWASEQILSIWATEHLSWETKSLKYILDKKINCGGLHRSTWQCKVPTNHYDWLNSEMNISREGRRARPHVICLGYPSNIHHEEGMLCSGKMIQLWQEDDILLFFRQRLKVEHLKCHMLSILGRINYNVSRSNWNIVFSFFSLFPTILCWSISTLRPKLLQEAKWEFGTTLKRFGDLWR